MKEDAQDIELEARQAGIRAAYLMLMPQAERPDFEKTFSKSEKEDMERYKDHPAYAAGMAEVFTEVPPA